MQVILHWCPAPGQFWLPALAQEKAEVSSCGASSGELEFPWQLLEFKPPAQWPDLALGLCKMLPRLCHPPQDGGWVQTPSIQCGPGRRGGSHPLWSAQGSALGTLGCEDYFSYSSGGSLPMNVSFETDFLLLFHPCSLCRLVHLAIIHCVPDVALCCIAQLPRELLEIQNDLFQTPLHLAVYLEQPSIVQALIHKGVNPGLQDRNGNTPLHLACEQQRLRCAQQLLQGTAEPPGHLQDLQLQNWQGLACLHISTLKGNIQMMSLLLQSGANIDVQEGTSGKTPLHMAVECHNRSAVQFLLHNGAYVDAQMYNGCTPLHLAVGRKDAAIAAILSHSGADTLLRNMENETAQDLADGNDDLLALLPFDDLKISGKPVVCSE
uniref:NFKB inhibitor epsilon n=1 Tax=Meleagris gallopavo TaxID=9103 RepID=G1NE98_MELGA